MAPFAFVFAAGIVSSRAASSESALTFAMGFDVETFCGAAVFDSTVSSRNFGSAAATRATDTFGDAGAATSGAGRLDAGTCEWARDAQRNSASPQVGARAK